MTPELEDMYVFGLVLAWAALLVRIAEDRDAAKILEAYGKL